MTTYREELEAWLREPLPPDPRDRAQEEAARALVRGGLKGALSWTQVYRAMHVIEDEASSRRLDQVERSTTSCGRPTRTSSPGPATNRPCLCPRSSASSWRA